MEPVASMPEPRRPRAAEVARAIAYWLAVLVISLALVVALIAWLNSRDHGSVHGASHAHPAWAATHGAVSENPRSLAKATIR
jgi:hypothetical protein